MKILLINIDSIIPNLALKKIEKYHIDRGDEVIWDNELMRYSADKIYVSCIFDWNKEKCIEWEGCEIGGSGYSLSIILPEEIENIKPKINIGFTTRGCIRNCFFCIVPQKEGKIKSVGDIYDIWDEQSKDLTLLDNNILALPEHFKLICFQLRKEKLRVDFNQGLDHRLLTDDLCKELLSVQNKELRFAFDDVRDEKTVLEAIEILKKNGVKDFRTRWYVYVGKNDTYETVLTRLNILREHKQGVYIMRDKSVYKIPVYIALAKWSNTMGAFKSGTFEEVLEKSENMKPYKKLLTARTSRIA